MFLLLFQYFIFKTYVQKKKMSKSDYENLNTHAKKIQSWKNKSYRDKKKLLKDIDSTTISNFKKYLHSVCDI